MPNQHDGFCYLTIEDAARADLAGSPFSVNNGLASASSYAVTSTNTVDVVYYFRSFETSLTANFSLQRTYPECLEVGLTRNSSGVSISDALTVSWLIVGVWLAAYFFKTLRTGVRGY